jgi:hypothetical protein
MALPSEQHGSPVLRDSGVDIAVGQGRAAATWPIRRSASGLYEHRHIRSSIAACRRGGPIHEYEYAA